MLLNILMDPMEGELADALNHLQLSKGLTYFLTYGAYALAILVILYLIYRLFERQISRFLKEKEEQIRITKVHISARGSRTIDAELTRKGKKKRRTFFMPFEGFDVGDEGRLWHKGRYGTNFQRTSDLKHESTDYHYHYKSKKG